MIQSICELTRMGRSDGGGGTTMYIYAHCILHSDNILSGNLDSNIAVLHLDVYICALHTV